MAEYVTEWGESVADFTVREEVVRCGDCESATDHCEGIDVYWCEYLSRYVGADTFCAWASRKESE